MSPLFNKLSSALQGWLGPQIAKQTADLWGSISLSGCPGQCAGDSTQIPAEKFASSAYAALLLPSGAFTLDAIRICAHKWQLENETVQTDHIGETYRKTNKLTG